MKITLLVTILIAVLGRFMSDEVKAWSAWVQKRIRRIAVARLPESVRGRYDEEWENALEEIPGEILRLFYALGFLRAAGRIRDAAPAARSCDAEGLESLSNGVRQPLTFDQNYILSLRAGDPSTQEHFVRYFTELLRLKLRSRLGSSQAVEDLTQQTFVRAFYILRKDGVVSKIENLGAFVNAVCNLVLFENYPDRM